MTKPFRDYLARQLQDPEFAAIHEAHEQEYQAERARIAARLREELSQDPTGAMRQYLEEALALAQTSDLFCPAELCDSDG